MEERKDCKKEFFAAANSGKGFVSFYSQIFGNENIKRRYLIKGGPGTGKSTFMKYLADRSEENGLGVEYFRCSSDPSSLDALIIAGRVAVIDATSPHCVEPEFVGAKDEIIDLGAFWDSAALGERLDEIKRISELKKACYARAYRFLGAAMQVDEVNRELGAERADKEKMRKAVKRLAKSIPDGDGFELKVRLCNSIGMSGSVRLGGYERSADMLYVIKDEYRLGAMYLAMLVEEARSKGCAISVSYCPINPSYPDALLFEDSGVAFALEDASQKENEIYAYINMKRFVTKSARKPDVNKEYKKYARLLDGLVEAAMGELAAAGREHFELEEIYRSNMDFASQRKFLSSVCEKIVGSAQRLYTQNN